MVGNGPGEHHVEGADGQGRGDEIDDAEIGFDGRVVFEEVDGHVLIDEHRVEPAPDELFQVELIRGDRFLFQIIGGVEFRTSEAERKEKLNWNGASGNGGASPCRFWYANNSEKC